MNLHKKNALIAKSAPFHTGVKSLLDRRIGGAGLLQIEQILQEKSKVKNLRNGKVR